jgi:hypothetical protein
MAGGSARRPEGSRRRAQGISYSACPLVGPRANPSQPCTRPVSCASPVSSTSLSPSGACPAASSSGARARRISNRPRRPPAGCKPASNDHKLAPEGADRGAPAKDSPPNTRVTRGDQAARGGCAQQCKRMTHRLALARRRHPASTGIFLRVFRGRGRAALSRRPGRWSA